MKTTRRAFISTLALTSIGLTLPKPAYSENICDDDDNGEISFCKTKLSNPINCYQQQETNWCWAACVSMIFDYWGHNIPQIEIVREVYPGLENHCGQLNDITRLLNRKWQDEYSIPFASYGEVNAPIEYMISGLTNNKPIMLGLDSHAYVIYEIDYVQNYWEQIVMSVTALDPRNCENVIIQRNDWLRREYTAVVDITPDNRT